MDCVTELRHVFFGKPFTRSLWDRSRVHWLDSLEPGPAVCTPKDMGYCAWQGLHWFMLRWLIVWPPPMTCVSLGMRYGLALLEVRCLSDDLLYLLSSYFFSVHKYSQIDTQIVHYLCLFSGIGCCYLSWSCHHVDKERWLNPQHSHSLLSQAQPASPPHQCGRCVETGLWHRYLGPEDVCWVFSE